MLQEQNFKTATNSHLGYISAFFVRKTVNVVIMNYATEAAELCDDFFLH